MHAALFLHVFLAAEAFAQTCDEDWSAELVSAEGDVEARRLGDADWSPASRGEFFCLGDSIRTLEYGRGVVVLPDGAQIKLDRYTTVTVTPPQDQTRSWFEILRGALYIISRDPTALGVLTAYANAGIEGTEFLVAVSEDEMTLTVFEGAVAVTNAAGQISATSGQRVSVLAGQPPIAQVVVRPRDAAQWTLYYAPVVGAELPEPDEIPSSQDADEPTFYTRRASARLDVGRVDEALEDIEMALSLRPNDATALSLQAIIAITQNDKAEGLRLADLAVSTSPESAAARIAQSYARQAFFDVSGALSSLQEAVNLDSTNALVWARLSEMWLAVGDVSRALQAAEEAIALNPDVARTQTVVGFAYLTDVGLDQAMSAFRRAIELDDSAPLPRLGLGLALIREGQLTAGREQLEIAVMLDPGNALVRSYMGKAYYEEKRGELAETQLEIAKGLDPLDPTPFFYDAILEQTSNRPIEALRDLKQSIALNDNRATYRSRLLLDEDLGVRSAGLGRIYTDLSFERLAVAEGAKSVISDPGGYSGHRLLADTYGALPRHELARVSELFQSQLLQPLNITPIQAQLAEANLFLLDRAGPAQISFNEFSSLFNRNGVAFHASAVKGGNSTSGQNLTLSGIADRVSYSAGYFHFETDGFRANNDLEQEVLNGFVQYRLSPDLTLLGEVRSTERSHGDLDLRFHAQNFLPSVRTNETNDSTRFGIRRSLSPRSELIGSIIYQDVEATDLDPPVLSFAFEMDGYTAELLHIFAGERWRQSTGIRYMARDSHDVLLIQDQVPFPPFVVDLTVENDVSTDTVSLYSYTYFDFTERLTIVGGASADQLDVLGLDQDHVNPKLGLLWAPNAATNVRAAAFRTVQFPTYSRQDIQPRLEPTHVAGINQRYFGLVGEEAESAAVAIDRALGENLSVGAQLIRREVEVPFIVDVPGVGVSTAIEKVDERQARAYAYWTPTPNVAVAFEYQYDSFKHENQDFTPQGFAELVTHRIPVQLSYYNSGGLIARLVATAVDQEGLFAQQAPPFLHFRDEDKFWVLDASLGYRLPKRVGVVSLEIANLLDEQFNFQDIDPQNPRVLPERLALLKFTVAMTNRR